MTAPGPAGPPRPGYGAPAAGYGAPATGHGAPPPGGPEAGQASYRAPAGVVPAPPRGPGVQPPFVTPPIDGTRRRRWLAVGLAIATVLICLVGGVAGLGGLGLLAQRAAADEARATVTRYLSAIQHKTYDDAYLDLCAAERARTSRSRFVQSFENAPAVRAFQVGEAQIDDDLTNVSVPATVQYDDGDTKRPTYLLVQEGAPGAYRVCGTRD